MLEGTFSLIISFLNEPETLYITKNGSPLLLSYTDKIALISSEESGFNNITKNYIRLNNNDIYKISYDNMINITTNVNEIKELIENKDYLNKSENSYKPFNNWTEKEIYKQDISLYNCINNGGRIKNEEEVMLGGLEENIDILKNIDNLIILGCGSSYYSSLLGKFYFKELSNLNIILPINACEFELDDIPKIGKTALLFLSQSGETMDLYKILEKVKNMDILTIGLINSVNSTIANETDCGVYLNIGKEHGVASTKSFTSQCLVLCLTSIFLSQIHNINNNIRKKYIEEIKSINYDVNLLLKSINEQCKNISTVLSKYDNIFVIGKHQSESIALEGALKIKEITYIHCEGYSASMLKHGPFSLLSENTPVIIIIPDDKFYDKTYSVLEQINSRGSPIYLISNKYINGIDKENTIIMPKKNKLYSILNIIPLQIIAYYISILRNINPDFPRNLAKVVTVE
jgi:glucosamine--fructose-6-phosphate aminotransferase (isomerizing)